MKYFLMTIITISFSYASELKVNTFYKLNTETFRDSAAEVCFSLKPVPKDPIHVQVTVDPNTRSAAYYNTWVDNRGSACLVVSTRLGRVKVEIPQLNIKTQKQI